MHLEDARQAITAAITRMNTLYGQTVFDEWIMVSLRPGRGSILAYSGPRADTYKQQFGTDARALHAEIANQKLAAGDFVFAHSATGSQHDACLCLGETGYLFCNHTAKSMDEIRKSPLWLKAQTAFADLSEKFRADPLL